MRILFVLSISLDKQATSGHLLNAMISELCAEGHTVHILQKDKNGKNSPIPEEISKYSVTTDCIPFCNVNKSNFLSRYINEIKYIKSCKRYITKDYDAVFVQSTTIAGIVVRIIRKKLPNATITFNVQDIFPYNLMYTGTLKKNGFVFRVLASIQHYGYMHSDHIITISDDMKDTLIEDGVPADKIDVIYNWSYQDELYEHLDLTPVASMFSSNYFNVVYAGNIGVMQNVDIIIEAARLLKDDKSVRFHIIGDGVYKDRLEKRAKEYGIDNIAFWPMQSSEIAPLIYKSADVNVIPLVKDIYRTALPSKTATCLACEKPIVFVFGSESKFGQKATNEAGCYVTESDSANQLVDCILKIKDNNVDVKQMGEFFKKFCSKSKNSKQYAAIITDLKH